MFTGVVFVHWTYQLATGGKETLLKARMTVDQRSARMHRNLPPTTVTDANKTAVASFGPPLAVGEPAGGKTQNP